MALFLVEWDVLQTIKGILKNTAASWTSLLHTVVNNIWRDDDHSKLIVWDRLSVLFDKFASDQSQSTEDFCAKCSGSEHTQQVSLWFSSRHRTYNTCCWAFHYYQVISFISKWSLSTFTWKIRCMWNKDLFA